MSGKGGILPTLSLGSAVGGLALSYSRDTHRITFYLYTFVSLGRIREDP
jgi:hypothetical protein